MNWKRLAELALSLVDNFNPKTGNLTLKTGDETTDKCIHFEMDTYFSPRSIESGYAMIDAPRCATSCCACGWAIIIWEEEAKKIIISKGQFHFNAYDVTIELLSTTKDDALDIGLHPRIFGMHHPNDPIALAKRVYDLMDSRHDIEWPTRLGNKIELLRAFVAA